MTNQLDVLALSKEVQRDCKSGNLSRELLAQGQTLCGRNPQYPNYLERFMPNEKSHLAIGGMVSL